MVFTVEDICLDHGTQGMLNQRMCSVSRHVGMGQRERTLSNRSEQSHSARRVIDFDGQAKELRAQSLFCLIHWSEAARVILRPFGRGCKCEASYLQQ